jgi:serine/threonine protein kinase
VLEYLFDQGYVYRDIKASNVIIDSIGRIKIVDFGFAKKIGKNGRTNSFVGTIHSMAPEMFEKRDEHFSYAFEVDAYAFGILLYELTVG